MAYEIVPRYCNGDRLPGWRVQLTEGHRDRFPLVADVSSYVDAAYLRNMLNSVHPDTMVAAMNQAVAEHMPEAAE